MQEQPDSEVKRGPGRPKGAKNKRTAVKREAVAREAAPRHDRVAAPAPIDGHYEYAAVADQDPAYEYAGVSDADQAMLGSRGYFPESFGPNSAHFKWDPRCRQGNPRQYKIGDEQRFGEMTLMKVHREHIAQVRKSEEIQHQRTKYANDQVALNSGGQAAHAWSEIDGGNK